MDPPASRQPLRIPSDQLARQAAASLGGHLFQATRAATEWSHLADDARLLIEVAEDYAVLVSIPDVSSPQVPFEKSPVLV